MSLSIFCLLLTTAYLLSLKIRILFSLIYLALYPFKLSTTILLSAYLTNLLSLTKYILPTESKLIQSDFNPTTSFSNL